MGHNCKTMAFLTVLTGTLLASCYAFTYEPSLVGRSRVASAGPSSLNKCRSRKGTMRQGSVGLHSVAVKPVEEAVVPPPLKQTAPQKISVMVEPTPFTHVSGYSNRYQEMLNYLALAGDQVNIMCPDDTPDPPTEYKGFPITYTPGFRFSLYNHICLSSDHTFTGFRLLKENKPDVLHISTPGFLVLIATIYARLLDIPVVMSYHTHLPVYAEKYIGFMPFIVPITWQVVRFIHNFADLTLVTSPQMKADFEAHGVERVEVWRKGINTQNFNPKWRNDATRNMLTNGHPNSTLLIYVGRLGKEKRIQDLRPMLDADPNLRLALVGVGPYRPELEEIFKGTNTVFTGMLRGQPLWEAFASADVMCMPSDSETLGFVVLESLASGVPVVAANAGGLPDLIAEGNNGFLVPAGDTEAICDRVLRLAQDADLRRTMGDNGRKFAQLWSWESATSVLRNVQYPKALDNFKQIRDATPAPIRYIQIAGLILVGFLSTSLVGFASTLDSAFQSLTKPAATDESASK